MWTVVYMTQDKAVADKVVDLLARNNLIYKLKPVGDSKEEYTCYGILVPETEINEAHNIIIENNLI